LNGHKDREHAEVDMYVDQVLDIQDEVFKTAFESDAAKKQAAETKLYNEVLPQKLAVFEQRLGRTGKDHLVPSGVTIADIYLFSLLESFGSHRETLLAKFPHITKLEHHIAHNHKVAEYLSKRPQTQF
jgi:glutathione S-transferase